MNLPKDLKEFVELLNGLDVRFLIVGAFAVGFHGYPRYTSDIDIFVDKSAENAELLVKAIREFGFGDIGLSKEDFMHMLKRNMQATGRSQDLVDLDHL